MNLITRLTVSKFVIILGFHGTGFWFMWLIRPLNRTIISSILIVSACAPNSNPENYFPLEDGMVWIYKAEETRGERTSRLREIIYSNSVDKSEDLADAVLTSLNGTRTLYKNEDDSVYQIPSSDEAIYSTRELVLPREPKVGRRWTKRTNIRLLEAAGPWEKPIPISGQITMNYLISELDKQVHLRKKIYNDCLILDGDGEDFLYGGEYLKDFKVTVKIRKWLCSEIGLVKYSREERASNKYIEAAKIEMELIHLRR